MLDDLVLDVSKFKREHPGGRFLIEYNRGRDISKFFYGGYVLETGNGQGPFAHSNVARVIVNGLIVARIDAKASTFNAKIKATHNINSTTTAFTMRAET